MATTAFGRFLEISLPTADIRISMDFYRRLGFSELPVGDIRPYHYGVVTDGRIAIGLHAGGLEEPALSFVQAEVAATLSPSMADEDTLSFVRLGEESFHEIGLRTPDDQLLVMMEARTFSRADLTELPAPIIGRLAEISLGCRNVDASIAFWTGAGMTAGDAAEDSHDGPVELLAPGLRLGLDPELKPGDMLLRFFSADLTETLAGLERAGIAVSRSGDRYHITSPEGTRLECISPEQLLQSAVQALPRN